MGAYVSTAQCTEHHSVILNCTVKNSTTTPPYLIIGGHNHSEFESNPDVAGIGVVYAFFSVAGLALLTSAIYLILQLTRFMKFTGVNTLMHQLQETTRAKDSPSYRTTWADIFEAIILSCSDQQVFVSGAYALTLRYAQGCTISAYHYNIVANMMLITCATHLMSVTVVSQYWKHKLLAALRILLITGLYIVTCLLLSNQNAELELQWPTSVPRGDVNDTLLVLPAACFEGNTSAVDKTLRDTFGRGAKHITENVIGKSTPSNHIQGWNFFILMILWYGAAMIAELFRLWYHRPSRAQRGPRARCGALGKWIGRAFWFYQFAGTTFCMVAIVMSYKYIQDLRRWMDKSPWLRKPDGTNPENDPTSFGQLVPLLLILLTVFAILQLIDKFSEHLRRGAAPDQEALQGGSPTRTSPSQSSPEKKAAATVQATSVPPTPFLELGEPQYHIAAPSLPTPSIVTTPPLDLGEPQH